MHRGTRGQILPKSWIDLEDLNIRARLKTLENLKPSGALAAIDKNFGPLAHSLKDEG